MRSNVLNLTLLSLFLTGSTAFGESRNTGGGSVAPLPADVQFSYRCEMNLVEGSDVYQLAFNYDQTAGQGTGHLTLRPTAANWSSQNSGKRPRIALGHEFRITRNDATLTMAVNRDSTVTYLDPVGFSFDQTYRPTKDRLVMFLEQRTRTAGSMTRNVLSVVCLRQ